jgi:hypothetical protein
MCREQVSIARWDFKALSAPNSEPRDQRLSIELCKKGGLNGSPVFCGCGRDFFIVSASATPPQSMPFGESQLLIQRVSSAFESEISLFSSSFVISSISSVTGRDSACAVLNDFSFPRSAWKRTAATLCVANRYAERTSYFYNPKKLLIVFCTSAMETPPTPS